MKRTKKQSVKAECMECGKNFYTASMFPKCPRCKGTDIDMDAATVPIMWYVENDRSGQ